MVVVHRATPQTNAPAIRQTLAAAMLEQ